MPEASDGGSRRRHGPRDDRRRRAHAPAFPNRRSRSSCRAASWSPRRRASASRGRCGRSATSTIAAPRACAPRPPTSSAWSSATSATRSSAELAAGIEDALYKLGFTPILANTNEDPDRQAQVLRSLREHSVAGIIMSPARGADTWTLAQQWPQNIPAVITMRRMIGSSLPYVGPDNHRGERYAVEHLLRLGHRRIGFIGGDSGMTTQQERVGGWRAALNGWGVAADEALIFEAPPTRDGGRIAIERALAGAAAADRLRLLQRYRRHGSDARADGAGNHARPRHRRGGFRRHRRRRTQCSAADHRQRGYPRDGPSLRGEPAGPDPTRRSRRPVFRRRVRVWSCAKAAAPDCRAGERHEEQISESWRKCSRAR